MRSRLVTLVYFCANILVLCCNFIFARKMHSNPRLFITLIVSPVLACSLLPAWSQPKAAATTTAAPSKMPVGSAQDRAKELNRQAIALQSQGKLSDAVALYRQAIGLNPAGAGYHNNLALALKDLDQTKEAESEERLALKLRPKRSDYLVNLGIILQRQKRYLEAQSSFKDALALDAGDSDCNFRLGQTYFELGDFDKAMETTKLALLLKPENADYNELMGDIYLKSAKLDDAMIQYRKVIEIRGYTPGTISGELANKIDFIKKSSKSKL